ncbi:hypothetical protein SELMODRAFT_425371 [Selaginella moellendorffii]|uniref:Exostosin GT47 domain-containing protein n=1 Tax=Selaginella moellendorffii TaxID=88036 RepID=D8SSW5_SELML|nr:hypothetical protein SELMODRAFT_425371 [Selaginella moellendorffii]
MGRAHGIKRVGAIPTLLVAIVAIACIVTALSSIFSAYRPPMDAAVIPGSAPDRSFLSSLDRFLERGLGARSRLSVPWTGSAEDLDRGMEDRARSSQVLRVYVYDMPEKFTLQLLRLFRDTYKETANLTSNGSPVHRLIGQHSIDYWLYADLLAPESQRLLKSVKRVLNPTEADIFYIPFFTTISYFLMEKQQCKQLYREALSWVTNQAAWKRSGGRDHVLPVHHPWSFKSVRRFMKTAIWLLPDLDSTGNWYKPGEVSLAKDIVLPYVPNVDACDAYCLETSWSQRHTFSIFCLSPAGDTPSSARLFDAIVSGCIPVIVSDELEPPFEGLVDYRKVALFVPSVKTTEKGWLVSYLRAITARQLSMLRGHMLEFSRHFQYSSPAQQLGPEDLTWQTVAGKLQSIRLHIRRAQRLVDGGRNIL